MGRYLKRQGLNPKAGQWFQFVDINGIGHAQTDFYIVCPRSVLLIECKLSQTQKAFLQMAQLYVPLLEFVYQLPVSTLLACKNLRYRPEAERTPEELIIHPEIGNFTWHFLGF